MKKLILITLLLIPFLGLSQIFTTRDKNLDANLNIFNSEAKKDLAAFKLDIKSNYNVSEVEFDNMLKMKMEPAEIYLVLEIALITKKNITEVLLCYEKNKDRGWGHIAKEMGIKPGSPEFHELKGKAKTKANNYKANSANQKSKGKAGNTNGNSGNENTKGKSENTNTKGNSGNGQKK